MLVCEAIAAESRFKASRSPYFLSLCKSWRVSRQHQRLVVNARIAVRLVVTEHSLDHGSVRHAMSDILGTAAAYEEDTATATLRQNDVDAR